MTAAIPPISPPVGGASGGDLAAYDTRAAYPGKGLLTRHWEQGADQLVLILQGAYKHIAENKADNIVAWATARKSIRDAFASRMRLLGLEPSPMDEDVFYHRLAPEHWCADASAHIAFVRAVFTDYTDRFWRHIEHRLGHEANVHYEWIGGTGTGKSSCAITVADWMQPIEPDHLLDHVNFDLGELQDKLKTKRPRETVIQDEFLQQSGEGARTVSSLFANIEDTLRASQVSLFTCSPRRHEHATMQAQLEALFYNSQRRFTVFLVWKNDHPLGVVAIPWCRDELYAAYKRFKDRNVARSLSGAFQDRDWTIRNACRAFEDPNFVDWMVTLHKGKQWTKTDFYRAIGIFRSESMAGSQRETLAAFMVEMVHAYKRAEPKFRKWFGVDPPAGLRTLAGKASQVENDEDEENDSGAEGSAS